MLKDKRIGIIGGIGPEASAIFYFDLIKALQKHFTIKSNADYPQIIINNIAVPDLIDKEIFEEDIEPILSGLKELDKFIPDFNVIVCNSAYSFFDYLNSNTQAELLNLSDIVEKHIKSREIRNIGIIGTEITLSSVYKFAYNENFTISEEQQHIINRLITNFNKGKYQASDKIELEIIINDILNKGAEFVMLACTELSLMGKGIKKTINPMHILIDEIILKLKE